MDPTLIASVSVIMVCTAVVVAASGIRTLRRYHREAKRTYREAEILFEQATNLYQESLSIRTSALTLDILRQQPSPVDTSVYAAAARLISSGYPFADAPPSGRWGVVDAASVREAAYGYLIHSGSPERLSPLHPYGQLAPIPPEEA